MQQKKEKDSARKICLSEELAEKTHRIFPLIYRKEEGTALIIRYRGEVYGYLNLCAHMPRRLDCECDDVFDEAGELLRCTMHGIVYDPVSGEARSEICLGQKLTRIAVIESEGEILLSDKKAELIVTE